MGENSRLQQVWWIIIRERGGWFNWIVVNHMLWSKITRCFYWIIIGELGGGSFLEGGSMFTWSGLVVFVVIVQSGESYFCYWLGWILSLMGCNLHVYRDNNWWVQTIYYVYDGGGKVSWPIMTMLIFFLGGVIVFVIGVRCDHCNCLIPTHTVGLIMLTHFLNPSNSNNHLWSSYILFQFQSKIVFGSFIQLWQRHCYFGVQLCVVWKFETENRPPYMVLRRGLWH